MPKLWPLFLSCALACLGFGLPVAQAEDSYRLSLPSVHRVHRVHRVHLEPDTKQPNRLNARSALPPQPPLSMSDPAVVLLALILSEAALGVGASHTSSDSALRRPAVFGIAAGATAFVVVGTWAGLNGADTGAPLVAFMSGMFVGPLAGLLYWGTSN